MSAGQRGASAGTGATRLLICAPLPPRRRDAGCRGAHTG
jgi:hypothetical protein